MAIGIPFATVQFAVFGLLLTSIPIGIFLVFDSEIGGDISHELPLSHLELFKGTGFYQSEPAPSVGDAFVVLWTTYLALFVVGLLGPRAGFAKSLSTVMSHGRLASSNYLLGATMWTSMLVLASAIIMHVQDWFGIPTIPPPVENNLVQFFYASLAPLAEEFGFRMILLGVPFFLFFSARTSLASLASCMWNPSGSVTASKGIMLLIILVGILFGFAHIAFEGSWSQGKLAQATAGGIILGWVYLRYGFVAALLIHWATNYVVFAYANFISQVNVISINDAFAHHSMSVIVSVFLISGMLAAAVLFAGRFYRQKLEV